MNAEGAFSAVLLTLTQNLRARILDKRFSETAFGSFYISYALPKGEGSIVNDRDQLFICDEPRGAGNCNLLFASIRRLNEQELTSVLVAKLS